MRAAHPANVGGDGGDRLKSLIPGSVDRLGRELKRTTASSRKHRAHCLGNSPSRSARSASSSNSGGDSSRPARKWSRITSAQQRPTVAALVGVLREFAYEGKPPGRSWPVLAVSRSERGEMLGLPQNALAQGRDKLAEHRVGAALPLDRENCAVRRCLSQRTAVMGSSGPWPSRHHRDAAHRRNQFAHEVVVMASKGDRRAGAGFSCCLPCLGAAVSAQHR